MFNRMARRVEIEKDLSEMLDQNIKDGNLDIALSVLGMVKDTFSKYAYYIKLVNDKITTSV